jgi:sodium-dependent dicarboxylate transporter 2/3/5
MRPKSGKVQALGLWLGPLLAFVTFTSTSFSGLNDKASLTAGITMLCAVWWILEPIPIPVTSLLPFALFPFAGVLDHKSVSTAYGHHLILLLMGGFLLSTAMESSGAHRRVAMTMLKIFGGGSRRRVVAGFMVATALLSMWISNTATVLMMIPVAGAILEQDKDKSFMRALLLGLAYSASIGGMGTLVGTPPNIVFSGVFREETGREVGFASWMLIGIPVVIILVPMAWFFLTHKLSKGSELTIPSLASARKKEKRVLLVFAWTILLWVTRSAPFGGWSQWLGMPGVGDSTIALQSVVLMFLIPDGEGQHLLEWETAKKIPWGLLLLFGGGIAIARAFMASGLSDALGHGLSGLAELPAFWMTLFLCLSVTFLTEVTSNTATTTLLMPVLAAAAKAASIEPALLMVPAALSASCAFMLPVATAPNAIVFGTGRISTKEMARAGFFLNVFFAFILTLLSLLLVPLVFAPQ